MTMMMMMMMMMTMKAGVIVHERQNYCHSVHISKRSDFHFSESQRVAVGALPVIPHHTVRVRRCVAAGVVVEAVQVGTMTVAVPPSTSHLCV